MNRASTHKYSGGCHCGNIQVEMTLPQAAHTYQPRACDCSFCCKHGASYISDAKGSVTITVTERRHLGQYRQGNEIATFLFCQICGVLVGVSHEEQGHLYAALNSRVFSHDFGKAVTASPQLLGGAEKIQRWQAVWFSDVNLIQTEPER